MKLTSTASLAVVALLMAATTPSFAQLSVDAGGGVNVGVEAGSNGDNGGVSVGAGANADANVNTDSDRDSRLLGGLTAAIDSDATVDITSIGDDDNVDFVLVSDASADVSAEFQRYRERNAARNTDLSGSVSANASLMAKLQAEGHDADDVVAITGNADGSFTVWLENK